MMEPPDIWYAKQDLSKHYMRDTSRPFEEGVSRGQLKRIRKCEAAGITVESSSLDECYPIIVRNRERNGRKHSTSFDEWKLRGNMALFFVAVKLQNAPMAGAMCVRVALTTLYVSAWGDEDGYGHFSPVCLLCKGIYNWCAANGFTTLDIGIGGDEGLNQFKERLRFTKGMP